MAQRRLGDRLIPSRGLLSVALGVTVGIDVLAALTIAIGRPSTANAVTAPAVAACVGTVFLSTFLIDPANWLWRSRIHDLLVAVPIGVFLVEAAQDWVTVVPQSGVLSDGTALVVMLGALPAGVVRIVADARRVAEICTRESPTVEWTARPPRRAIKRRKSLVFFGGVLVAVGVLADVVSADAAWILGGFIVANVLSTRSGDPDRLRGFAAFSDGLVVEPRAGLHVTVIPWSRLTGYEVTDDALVLYRGRWRGPIHSSKAEIDDLRTVIATLDTHIERTHV
ncbi:hypothetical protein ACFR9U_00135 [Halorientalis brevis]|uniref:PH domain-containing protein n=1 Tax=Halorientalis brevis TaxID=1126241 RepID=A0ABD6C6D6_9EURY|nr:hypothetical protein [Halorientalis brevis]